MPSTRRTPEQMRKLIARKKWIMAYNHVGAAVDKKTGKVLYMESYGPERGFFIEGWRALHYPLTSKLVEKSWREGGYTLALLHQGHSTLHIKPSLAPFGISDCTVAGNKVQIAFAGIGGAGVSVAYSRGAAEGVLYSDTLQEGGGAKLGKCILTLPKQHLLLVGVDDTDNAEEGATYALVHNLSVEAAALSNTQYSSHVNVQLYPYNEFKTRNCFATVVAFLYQSVAQKKQIIDYFKTQLKIHTVSANTAMAVYDGFVFSDTYLDYAASLKFRFASDLDELRQIATTEGIELYPITGERGLFGALSALAFFDRPDYAAKLPTHLA